MKFTRLTPIGLLLAAAATANGQVVVDGQISGGENYVPQWFQTNPTGFGDNHPSNQGPCNPIGQGVAFAINNSNTGGVSSGSASGGETVTTGMELKIPLAQLGNPAGAVRVCVFVNGSGHNYASNQVLSGLGGRGNLGGDGSGGFNGGLTGVNFSSIAGDQFYSIPADGGGCAAATMDGSLDGSYGAPIVIQNTQTGFGDSGSGAIDFATGSELDAGYGYICGGNLHLFFSGNLEGNFNKLDVFVDSIPGGQNVLRNDNADVDFNGLNTMAGLTFDAGFAPDYFFTVGGGNSGGQYATFASYAELLTNGGGRGSYIGTGGAGSSFLQSQVNCPPTIPDPAFAIGSEIDGIFAELDMDANRLNLMVTGNFNVDGAKLHLFFDADPASGQNAVRSDNVVLSIADGSGGAINRLGPGNELPGLVFDAAFAPDYYMNFHLEGGSSFGLYRNALDVALLRTNGRDRDFNGNSLDYGAFNGVDTDDNPIPFDGTNFCCVGSDSDIQGMHGIRFQDGFTGTLYSSFPPRHARALLDAAFAAGVFDAFGFNFFLLNGADGMSGDQRIPGLIRAACDNSNTSGVTSDSSEDAAGAMSGLEISIDLDELGWDHSTPIKVGGFITNAPVTTMSNQVIGGLPVGQGNLAEPRSVNFAAIEGDQFVTLDFAPPSGACCIDRCTCVITTESDCGDQGGVFGGVGSECNTEEGACFPNPACPCDVNGVDGLDSQDFFDFLNAFFAADTSADLDCLDGVDSQDYFNFNDCFFGEACN